MINIANKEDCCGCNACGDVCAHKAITFKTDNEGFWYPEVNKDLCSNCGLCEKVCPMINVNQLKRNDYDEPVCYAAQAKNLESLFNSTSGSAFATLAERMYKIGGYVGGAIFNEDFSVTQFISSEKSDLERLRNSKYVQSNSEGFFIAIKKLLNAGEKVLVCGLPCQMAGLRAFLCKDYDNLIVVDLICLGINSPKILRGYIDYMESKHDSKVIYFKAKSKELGWRNLTIKMVFENGDVEYDTKDTSYFTYGFVGTHAFSRPSCYNCKFKGFPRIADITLGDFWGAEKVVGKEYDRNLGTSIILINSRKGLDFYTQVKANFRETEVPFNTVTPENSALYNPITKPNIDREQFYKDLDNLSFIDFATKYITLPVNRNNWKTQLKNIAKFVYLTNKASGINVFNWVRNIYYNTFCRRFNTNIADGKFIVFNRNTVVEVSRKATVVANGILIFGAPRLKSSKLESRFLVERNATFNTSGGYIAYGADIEVFSGATLVLGKDVTFNMQATIICADQITIDDFVCFGRNVTVRDNNGGHYMSRRTYKDARPIKIGKHSWICEQAMVMPGAKIGSGVIVGARSMVSGKLPNFTLATGAPAEIVDENIYWKK